MAEQVEYQQDDEIDIAELFASLWSHKILIGLITGISIFLSGYHALTENKEYTASAKFKIKENDAGALNFTGELGTLASLAGLGGAISSGSDSLLERLMEREFILIASEKLSLEDDLFFQTYDPTATDPLWKSIIKRLIGWKQPAQNDQAIIERTVIENYNKYVQVSETGGGAISISVTHKSPKLSAQYANSIMDEVRKLIVEEDEKNKDFRLTYLAETLADALQEMENAQNNLKSYALENSTAAKENFISGSLALDNLRMELRDANEFIATLEKLKALVQMGNLNLGSYEALRMDNPLVDDVSFRRILGMSETISAWSWPDLETILNVKATLQDRIRGLNVEIAAIEENAKELASNAEDLAKLTREMKIAEATFTVLTEQVKSQSLAAGFKPDTFKVFAYATPPLQPSSPKRNLILALGAVLGLFIGSAISLINVLRKGVFYTQSSVISLARAKSAFPSHTFRRVARLSGDRLIKVLNKRKQSSLDDVDVLLASKNLIYVVNTGATPSASQTARLLAIHSSQSGRSVLLMDPTLTSTNDNETQKEISGFHITPSEGGFDASNCGEDNTFFRSINFETQLKALLSSYDQIIISSNNQKSNAGLIALKPFDPALVILTRLRRTKKEIIKNILSLHPITVLFYG
jgi:uncharacterized protein involved in exopolysaccharide biosynthesis